MHIWQENKLQLYIPRKHLVVGLMDACLSMTLEKEKSHLDNEWPHDHDLLKFIKEPNPEDTGYKRNGRACSTVHVIS